MLTSEQKLEHERRYLAELIKVGFSEEKAQEIVAEASERLGIDLDASNASTAALRERFAKPIYEDPKAARAVDVVVRKQFQQRTKTIPWNQIRKARASIEPGTNFMQAMQERLAADLRTMAFTLDDIEYILGADGL